MAQAQQSFQLFPTVQPQNHPPSGHPRKGHRRRTTKSPSVSPVIEDVKASGQTEAVILRIIEDTNIIVPPPPARAPRSRSPAIASKSVGICSAIVTQESWSGTPSPPQVSREQSPSGSVVGNPQVKARSFSAPSPAPSSMRPRTPITQQNGKMGTAECTPNNKNPSSPPFSRSESPNCASSASVPSAIESPPDAKKSAPPQMKSIFPVYDPNVPLDKQKYYPHRSSSLPQNVILTAETPSPPSIPVVPKVNTCPKPSGNERGPFVSSDDDLARLWEVTNGGVFGANLGTFQLQMQKVDAHTFVLGTHSTPFYTLRTNPMNDLEVHRTHPSEPKTKSSIVALNIGDLSGTGPTGIALTLFPKLAEILTRKEAMEVARRNQLSPQRAMEIENEAVVRSEAQNSCILELQPAQNQYNLYHAVLIGDEILPAARFAVSRPLKEQSGLLHASVLRSLPNTIATRQYPKIQIAAPGHSSNQEIPLASLDMETMALSISAERILSTVPSFYAIDTIVAAILTVAISNETSKSVLARMNTRPSKPNGSPDRRGSMTSQHTVGRPGIQLIATQAEREEVEQEAALMEQIRSEPRSQGKARFSLMSMFTGKLASDEAADVKPKQKNKKKPAAIEDIDLEHYGAYRDSKRADEKLPGLTRALLKGIIWVFSTIVWVLTVGVKFISCAVVTVTKCATRKKP
ncbi:hypothetical protein CPC735_007710 [Coccidioides posadasii C735 delta SOWgp]|uniref:Uncharacterized protein n=1 Tax=Coccidioides posadasii (strain C735) TaxID=222929 RepID=C5PA36_COCP7|nr:hypothetical protein CPC735_007710 [Coccidioides posadasii C735 delta SOWgp]EER26598.1 hypothetical protein CPC735_007710 [Coccidioides posadasii C735 delta SOWgp]|eukprot:XP_003068743.1 hypothetical protein CPC735_007710 [Coccidioides posadasii C735 delta SOWgp]